MNGFNYRLTGSLQASTMEVARHPFAGQTTTSRRKGRPATYRAPIAIEVDSTKGTSKLTTGRFPLRMGAAAGRDSRTLAPPALTCLATFLESDPC